MSSEARRPLGLAVSGRRFENASFLYQEAKLCVFCAQLLTKRDDGSVFASSRTASAQPKGLASTIADEARLDGWIAADALAEEAEHFADNCALRRPAYQSSTVDGRAAALAVDGDAEAQGLHRVSCTRREYEAWWECDLWRGGDVDIASVKIYPFLAVRSSALSPNSRTPKALRAPVAVSVLVLKRPLGSVRLHDARKFAVAELVIDNDSQPCVEWLLPLGTRGACVRVQVHGAKALQLRQVTVRRGAVVGKPGRPKNGGARARAADVDAGRTGRHRRRSRAARTRATLPRPRRRTRRTRRS
ncbi:hypothetical protein M885DRAFT_286979 [Pelagophyceae sp. CCMP2097]|nr:hypothetical protein M885DRAFT_286979 [Pelagophyceae sp. CCMP2097]